MMTTATKNQIVFEVLAVYRDSERRKTINLYTVYLSISLSSATDKKYDIDVQCTMHYNDIFIEDVFRKL